MSDWGDMLVAGILYTREDLVRHKFFVPKSVSTFDTLEFLVAAGRPLLSVQRYPDGLEIELNLGSADQNRTLNKASMYGLVIGGRQHHSAKDTIGVTEPVTVDDLLKLPVAEISAWLSDHEEELGIKDYEAILAKEVAGKKRSTVVKGLKALIGQE